MRILVIVAHPDDEVLGMGGLITKYTKNNDHVKIVIMATGILARREISKNNSNNNDKTKFKKQIEKLQKEAKNAAKIMGVKDLEFLDFPDNEMDVISNLKITKKIEKIIEKFNPDKLYTHSSTDINVDHRVIFNSVLTATRPHSNTSVKELISFETPSSTEWNFEETFLPNLFVDISTELQTKMDAIKAYKTEIRKFPHPRSVEGLEIIAKRWGMVSGFNCAEAYHMIRRLEG